MDVLKTFVWTRLALDPIRMVEQDGLLEDVMRTVRQVEGRSGKVELVCGSLFQSTSDKTDKCSVKMVDVVL